VFVDQRARLAVPDVAFDPEVDPAFVPEVPAFVPEDPLEPEEELPSDGSKMPGMRLPATVETDSAAVEILRTLCRY